MLLNFTNNFRGKNLMLLKVRFYETLRGTNSLSDSLYFTLTNGIMYLQRTYIEL